MTAYLSYTFEDSREFISTFDELPLWSASFGLLLLKHLEYKPDLSILDIGSGAGFPLMEIANRFGTSCKCYGLDVWTNANERAKQKIVNYGLKNVEVIEGSADTIPFEDGSLDLIVSNLGINNFDNPAVVFKECYRVLKHNGKLALTTNINGHWKEFYHVFESVLKEAGRNDLLEKVITSQEHRGNIESIAGLFTDNGFNIAKQYREDFEMKFADGTAFLNHSFVKLGWLQGWKNILNGEDLEFIFGKIESGLNAISQEGLTLTVPMLYMEGTKH